jgi:threonine/homoserine/homoserine lactone efflux protein
LDPAGLILFSSALFIAAVSPGPSITALVARVLGRGPWEAVPFSAGMAIGSVVWMTCSIVGLAALAQAFNWIFVIIKYAGAAYLLFLAYKLWRAPAFRREVSAEDKAERPVRLFFGGLAVTLGNPKSIIFYLALVPTLLDITRITILGYLELVGVMLAVLAAVFAGYIVLAARARRVFTSEKAIKALNRVTGTAMAGAAVAIATR